MSAVVAISARMSDEDGDEYARIFIDNIFTAWSPAEMYERQGEILNAMTLGHDLLGTPPSAKDSAILLSILLVNAKRVEVSLLQMMFMLFVTALGNESGLARDDFFEMVDSDLAKGFNELLARKMHED
jgi:hypothetical protein